ncbi:hypothetical protein H7849_26115 [Alloacidobacterium dinghuense]|uniref:DGQHR domain-containing protein n=1 Tax=Alloacidobacterium dinghuense TaxID=2763107 RepID=A0A7G8BIN9_9BACT|nr:DNA sulfur modification protein DndB [Alloacidobacterium dinghuense]QNI32409.1 hypothetical protein H7849_26115 [Alloacidobacterium dinghuense]
MSSIPTLTPSENFGNLTHAFQSADSSARPYNVLTGFNLGSNTLLLSVPMHQFYEISAVANEQGLAEQSAEGMIAQRKLDPKHAAKLATYILKGLVNTLIERKKALKEEPSHALAVVQKSLGKQPYMALQPVVANLRPPNCTPTGENLRWKELHPGVITVYLGDKDVLWVIDGQHRRYALELVFDFLKEIKMSHEYPKRLKLYPLEKGQMMTPDELAVWMDVYEVARTTCKIMVEVHLGLDAFQERQLFHDLNNLGKKIENSLAFAFDSSNPINLFIKDELVEGSLLNASVIEKDIVDWHNDPGAITWKDLTAINAILFLNKTNIKGAQPGEVADRIDVARKFWQSINQIDHFGQAQARKKTVAAQPVMLKALAKLTYDFAFGRSHDPQILERLLDGIPHLDLSHKNPMWRYYEMDQVDRKSSGLTELSEYLPSDEIAGGGGANRDIGRYDPTEHTMRFGAKHNDIFPLLSDMVRWRLQLPNRHQSSDSDAVAAD